MKTGFFEILNLALSALEGRGSLCRWDGERGILQYVVAFDRSRIQYADGLVSVTGDSLTSHLFFPLTANRMDRGGMLAMAEFLAYASCDLLPARRKTE